MRQEEKLAAAAARQLLKADAARERKSSAAQSRKVASSSTARKTAAVQKMKATGGAAATPEPVSSGRTTHVPEHGAGTHPVPFTDGSCFINDASNFYGGSPVSQPWMPSSDPAAWDKNPTPPGGFVNLMQAHLSQNFHFTGMSSSHASMENSHYVNVESGDELPRTEKRILWTQAEDVRMMSSWLHNSTDPSVGADRKNEQYWNDVVETYNETTPSNRKRNAKQIKDRFHKVNRWTDLFHSAWVKTRRIYTSGYNDYMWIEKAHVFT